MYNEKIGFFIAKMRKEKKLTQKELANKLGITDRAVSKWERGLCCPDISLLDDISLILDVSVVELLKGEKIKKEISDNLLEETYKMTKNYTKGEIIKILNTLIVVTIILVSSSIIYKNYYIHKINTTFVNIKKFDVSYIQEKINKIKNNRGNYVEEEYQEIIKYIKNLDSLLEDTKTLEGEISKIELNLKLSKIYELSSYNQIEVFESVIKRNPRRIDEIYSIMSIDNLSRQSKNDLQMFSYNSYLYKYIYQDLDYEYILHFIYKSHLDFLDIIIEEGEINE